MFSDWDEVPGYLKPKIEALVKAGWIHGYPDGTIRINETITMERFVNLAYSILERFEESADFDRLRLMRAIANCVVEVQSTTGTGAGVVVAPGKVVTNAHVVGQDTSVLVRWSSPLADDSMPRSFSRYNVIKRNDGLDLALIDVPIATHHVELDWVDSDFNAIDKDHFGETLYTQGSPLGVSGFLSRGQFGGTTFRFSGVHFTFSGGINPGNSGGGVFNLDGKLVGLIVAKPYVITTHPNLGGPFVGTADNLGLAIPSLAIKNFAEV